MCHDPVCRLCADCGSGSLETELVEDEIRYGSKPDTILLEYTAPVRTCQACGFRFMDHEAEKVREDRVNAYLYAIGQGRPKEWSPKWKTQRPS